MDVITHALLGAAIAPNEQLALPMAVSSTIPDWWTVPPLAEYRWRNRGRYRNRDFWVWIPPRYGGLTRWSHSVFPLLAVYAVGTLVFGVSHWVFLPWFLHLVIDIPSHARSRTGYLFYPWSRWQPLGARNWYDVWWFSIITIIILGGIVVARFFHF
ncbi:MAG: hypothetical protein HYY50_02160 [Candidatus Kerfeldbacteria bacterium]|nr:hypothetical protein [Candidatus Kerfeldbacteria bacterium]